MSQARRSLISELESAVQNGSKTERIDTLRRITDLFLSTSNRLNPEQIDVFDEVLGHLIKRVETRALAQLSERLAPVDAAPESVIRSLACSDEIAVAGPVLSQSSRISDADLVTIARTRGQDHLMAISGRASLQERLTDILVARGNLDVHRKLAASPQARFSERGFSLLVKSAETDDSLTEKLGLRFDLPLQMLRQLLAKASDIVREKLLQMAPSGREQEIPDILAGIRNEVLADLPVAPNFERAVALVRRLKQDGELDQTTLMQFLCNDQYAETIVTIAEMCAAPHVIVDHIVQSQRSEALLVPCRAADLEWSTVRELLRLRGTRQPSAQDIETMKSEYRRLTVPTAQRVLRFWCVQKAAGKDVFSG